MIVNFVNLHMLHTLIVHQKLLLHQKVQIQDIY